MKKTTEQKFVKKVGSYSIVAICELDDKGNIKSIIGYAVLTSTGKLILCNGSYCTKEKAIALANRLQIDNGKVGPVF